MNLSYLKKVVARTTYFSERIFSSKQPGFPVAASLAGGRITVTPFPVDFRTVMAFFLEKMLYSVKDVKEDYFGKNQDPVYYIMRPYEQIPFNSGVYVMIFRKGQMEAEDWHYHPGDPGGNRIVQLFTHRAMTVMGSPEALSATGPVAQYDKAVVAPHSMAFVSIQNNTWHRFVAEPLSDEEVSPDNDNDNTAQGALASHSDADGEMLHGLIGVALSYHPVENLPEGFQDGADNAMTEQTVFRKV